MHRDKFTEKLIRIVKAIEAGKPPAKVNALYVFGSYARGAVEPGDLDRMVVHDPADPAYEQRISDHFEGQGMGIMEAFHKSVTKFKADIRRALRKPGEPVHITLTQELARVIHEGSRVKVSDLTLIWSVNDQNWEAKIAAIKPDQTAGRAPRNHLVQMSRLHDKIGTMEAVVEMIDLGRLNLQRISVESIELRLNANHARWLAWWTERGHVGAKKIEILPYAMWWLQQHRQGCQAPDPTGIWSNSMTHRLEVGRPSLRRMLWRFSQNPKIKRQCLIPHFKVTSPNELLAFERGPTWDKFVEGDPHYDKVFRHHMPLN